MFTDDSHTVAHAVARTLNARIMRTALALTPVARIKPYPDVELELSALDGAHFQINHDAPRAPGSLGAACAAFWRRAGLKPIAADMAPAPSPNSTLLLRRLFLHDILHVLLGFDADAQGQLGVFSFVAAQRYCSEFEHAARSLAMFYTAAAPWARSALAGAERRGRQLAFNTPRLLTRPLEREWNTPLVALRDQLNIRKARALGPIRALLPAPRAGAPIAVAPEPRAHELNNAPLAVMASAEAIPHLEASHSNPVAG